MDIEKIKACHDEILNDFDRIDIPVNAAGGNIKEATTSKELSFFDLPLSALERVIGLNLFGGAILPCQVFGSDDVSFGILSKEIMPFIIIETIVLFTVVYWQNFVMFLPRLFGFV